MPIEAVALAANAVRQNGSPFSAIVVVSAHSIDAAQPQNTRLLPEIFDSGAVVHVVSRACCATPAAAGRPAARPGRSDTRQLHDGLLGAVLRRRPEQSGRSPWHRDDGGVLRAAGSGREKCRLACAFRARTCAGCGCQIRAAGRWAEAGGRARPGGLVLLPAPPACAPLRLCVLCYLCSSERELEPDLHRARRLPERGVLVERAGRQIRIELRVAVRVEVRGDRPQVEVRIALVGVVLIRPPARRCC